MTAIFLLFWGESLQIDSQFDKKLESFFQLFLKRNLRFLRWPFVLIFSVVGQPYSISMISKGIHKYTPFNDAFFLQIFDLNDYQLSLCLLQ